MITAHRRTLATTLTTIINVQKISVRTDIDDADGIVVLDVDSEGTVVATNTREDGRFAIVVPAATGTPGYHYRANIHQLKDSLATLNADTTTLGVGPLGGPMLISDPESALMRRMCTPPHAPATDGDTFPEKAVHLTRAAMKILAGSAAAANPRAGLDSLTSILIRQRPDRIETLASDRIKVAWNKITEKSAGRSGRADAPVIINTSTFATLSRLNCDVDMSLSTAEGATSEHVGVGSIRLVGPTWTFERRTLDVQFPNLSIILDREGTAIPVNYDGTIGLAANVLDDAARELGTQVDLAEMRWMSRLDGGYQLGITTPVDLRGNGTLAVAPATDLLGEGVSTMAPYNRILFNPKLLRRVLTGVGKKTPLQVSWGHSVGTKPLARLRIEHEHGVTVLAGITEQTARNAAA